MQAIDWQELITKYSDERIPKEVRIDLALVIAYAKKCHAENERLSAELSAAGRVLSALTKAVGTIDVPEALVNSLHPKDTLQVTDIKTESGGYVKRFKFHSHLDRLSVH
jgi:hypothetical protein